LGHAHAQEEASQAVNQLTRALRTSFTVVYRGLKDVARWSAEYNSFAGTGAGTGAETGTGTGAETGAGAGAGNGSGSGTGDGTGAAAAAGDGREKEHAGVEDGKEPPRSTHSIVLSNALRALGARRYRLNMMFWSVREPYLRKLQQQEAAAGIRRGIPSGGGRGGGCMALISEEDLSGEEGSEEREGTVSGEDLQSLCDSDSFKSMGMRVVIPPKRKVRGMSVSLNLALIPPQSPASSHLVCLAALCAPSYSNRSWQLFRNGASRSCS
jgi:hypothetical protein